VSSDALLAELVAAARDNYGLSPEDVAREAAPLVERAIKATAAAGTTPDGKPWPPKRDGGRALANAAEHIVGSADGATINVTLSGPDVWHHFGGGRNPKRQILPDAGAEIPPAIFAAIDEVCRRRFQRAIGGVR